MKILVGVLIALCLLAWVHCLGG